VHEFQVLWHDVRVETDDPEASVVINLVAQRASHRLAAQAQVHLTVLRTGEASYRVMDNGDLYSVVASPDQLFAVVFQRVYHRALELGSLKGWLHVHGAVAGFGGHRVALVGPSSAGKSTLAIGLLCEGANVEVDESFFTRDGEVVGVARRFHVKPGTLTLLNSVQWLMDAPVLSSPSSRAVDPTEHGYAWDLPVGPLHDIVLLRRTDGPSRLEPAPTSLGVQEVIGQVLPFLEPRRAIVRQSSLLVASARCHVLHAGPDRQAPALVRSLVG
jgi:HPr kinase/phosphorylase